MKYTIPITPRGYYDNLRNDVLEREGLMGTVPLATSNDPIIIEDDDISDSDIDFQVERFQDHLRDTHGKMVLYYELVIG